MSAPAGRRGEGPNVASVVVALRARGGAIVEELLRDNAHRWEAVSARDRHRIEEVARWVLEGLLSEPTQRAARLDSDHQLGRAEALHKVFGLGGPSLDLAVTGSGEGEPAGDRSDRPTGPATADSAPLPPVA